MVTFSSSATTERFILQVESDQFGLRMAGLTPFGHRLFVVSDDAQQHVEVQSESPLDGVIDAPHMLAGFQLATWPRARLLSGLRGTAVELTESGDGTRTLTAAGVVRFSATCQGKRPQCRHAVIRYEAMDRTLTIDTSDSEP
jgi:hypothetical protein